MQTRIVALTSFLCCLGAHATGSGGDARVSNAVTTRDMAVLRDIGGTNAGISISPSSRWVVFNLRQGDPERNEYRSQWILFDLATKKFRVLVKDAGPALLSYGDELPPVNDYNQGIQAFSPLWSADERKLYYVRKNREGIRLYVVDIDIGKSTPVESLPQGKVVELKEDDGAALVTLEVQAPDAFETVRQRRIIGMLFTGNEFAPVKGIPTFPAPTERRTVRMDLNTGAISKPRDADQDACEAFPGWPRDQDLSFMFRSCVFDPDGKAVAVGLDLGTARESAALYRPSSAKPKKISPSYDGLSLPSKWNRGTFYYVAHNGYSKSDVYEVDKNASVRKITESRFFLNSCEFNFSAAPIAVCTAETLTTPRELASVDLGSGMIEVLTDLNPEYNKRERPRTMEIDWTSPAGDLLRGTLTYPLHYDATRRYPVIVTSYPHPGFTRGSNGDEFPIPVFAAEGFLVLDVSAPAHYHWIEFDISYDTFARGYETPLRALEQYLQKLEDDGIADLSRVGVCGLSGGANFSAYAISHSRLFRASIFDWHETDHLATITLGRDRTRELHARRGLGIADTENWKAYSLGFRAEYVNAAVLLNVADSEFFLAFGSYDALKRNRNAVEMWIYPDAHHVKWLPGQRMSIYDRNVDWFNYWLRDVRQLDSAKADQYARWDALKARSASKPKDSS